MLCTCILNNDHILHSKCAGSSFTKWLCHEKHYYFKSLVKPVACTGLALKKPGPVGPRKNRRLDSTNTEQSIYLIEIGFLYFQKTLLTNVRKLQILF